MNVATENLVETVKRAVRGGPLADAVRDVQIEVGYDSADDEFLRVELQIKLPKKNVDSQLRELLERIEDAVAAVDDRYPSVRFLDAA